MPHSSDGFRKSISGQENKCPGSGAASPKRSEACGEDTKACDAMRAGYPRIAKSSATARATTSVHAVPHSSGNADHGLQFIPRSPEPASGRTTFVGEGM